MNSCLGPLPSWVQTFAYGHSVYQTDWLSVETMEPSRWYSSGWEGALALGAEKGVAMMPVMFVGILNGFAPWQNEGEDLLH